MIMSLVLLVKVIQSSIFIIFDHKNPKLDAFAEECRGWMGKGMYMCPGQKLDCRPVLGGLVMNPLTGIYTQIIYHDSHSGIDCNKAYIMFFFAQHVRKEIF